MEGLQRQMLLRAKPDLQRLIVQNQFTIATPLRLPDQMQFWIQSGNQFLLEFFLTYIFSQNHSSLPQLNNFAKAIVENANEELLSKIQEMKFLEDWIRSLARQHLNTKQNLILTCRKALG
jgi:hypothetical protein